MTDNGIPVPTRLEEAVWEINRQVLGWAYSANQ